MELCSAVVSILASQLRGRGFDSRVEYRQLGGHLSSMSPVYPAVNGYCVRYPASWVWCEVSAVPKNPWIYSFKLKIRRMLAGDHESRTWSDHGKWEITNNHVRFTKCSLETSNENNNYNNYNNNQQTSQVPWQRTGNFSSKCVHYSGRRKRIKLSHSCTLFPYYFHVLYLHVLDYYETEIRTGLILFLLLCSFLHVLLDATLHIVLLLFFLHACLLKSWEEAKS